MITINTTSTKNINAKESASNIYDDLDIEGTTLVECLNTRITKITIPNSVTSICDSAFADCPNLTIIAEATKKPPYWNVYWNPDLCRVVWNSKN